MKKRILLFSSAWGTEAVFAPQIEHLRHHYEIIVPDIHQFNNVRAMTDYVLNQYKHVYALIGLSMGGFVAQDILIHEPNFALKAVLMGTHSTATSEGGKEFMQGLIEQVRQGKLAELCPLYSEAVLAKESLKNKSLVELVKSMPLVLGEENCVRHHQACIGWDNHTDQLKNILADVLILSGEHDQVIPFESQKILQNFIPHSRLEIIKHAGHLMTLENSQQVNAVIDDFLYDNWKVRQ